MEWVIEDFTKGDLQLSWWTTVPNIQKVPLQGSYSVPPIPFHYLIAILRLTIVFVIGSLSFGVIWILEFVIWNLSIGLRNLILKLQAFSF